MTALKRKAKASPGKSTGKAQRSKTGASKQSAEMRRKLFVEAFLSNGENITKAALAAGFSAKSAASQGSRLLKDVKIQQILDTRRTEVLESAKLTTQTLHDSLRQALLFDPRKLFREDGTVKDVVELDDDTALALASFEVTEEFGAAGGSEEQEPQAHGGTLKRQRRGLIGYTKKVKWLDKNSARDQLAKMLGAYEKDNRQRSDPLTDLLGELMQRRSSLPIAEDA